MNTLQAHYASEQFGATQNGKILARLRATPGEWVPMPELYQVSGAFAVHSRINDLRKMGEGHFTIAHKNKGAEGVMHSFYKLDYVEAA